LAPNSETIADDSGTRQPRSSYVRSDGYSRPAKAKNSATRYTVRYIIRDSRRKWIGLKLAGGGCDSHHRFGGRLQAGKHAEQLVESPDDAVAVVAALYLARLDIATGRLIELRLVPFRICRFQLRRASREDAAWLRDTLDRESARFATRVAMNEDNRCRVLPR
jgi:hypothetical protein